MLLSIQNIESLTNDVLTAIIASYLFQGAFLVIGFYMLLQYVQRRKIDYLLYGIYAVLFAFYFFIRIEKVVAIPLFNISLESLQFLLFPLLLIITAIYIQFIDKFADIKEYSKGFSKQLNIAAYILYGIGIVSGVYSITTGNTALVERYKEYVMLPMHLYTLGAIIKAFIIIKSKIRYYILFSNFFLLSFSVVGVYLTTSDGYTESITSNFLYGFYPFNASQLGVFLEMLCFSLGLGYKFSQVEKRKDEIERLERFKNNLYTNIAHEVRTPLTLIKGPIENLMKNENFNVKEKSDLELINRNTNRLLNLASQMSDLALVDSGKIIPKILKGNLSSLLHQIADSFTYKAQDKNLKIKKDIPIIDNAWFDTDIIEKITSNLISNAIKYSNEHTEIKIKGEALNNNLNLTVINTSKDIGQKEIHKIFDRFYQHNNQAEGMGVGLALVKELVGLINGSITAETIDNNAVKFSVVLPIANKNNRHKTYYSELEESTKNLSNIENKAVLNDSDYNTILVVEDNFELRQYIRTLLEERHYIVSEAENGKQALHLIKDNIPDLIISDIMMPVMDGIELSKQIKVDEFTNHIPLLMLSAKATDKDVIDGLDTGADDYIVKPFSPDIFLSKVNSLIENRVRLKKYYQNIFSLSPDIQLPNREQNFASKLKSVLENHIASNSFTIDQFAKAMDLSRTHLHRKVKALSGLSSSAFLRKQRLNLAENLIKQKAHLDISEIAYSVGFTSPSYFIRCFKEEYNCTPLEFKKLH